MGSTDLFSSLAQPPPHVAPATKRSIGKRRPIPFIVLDREGGDPRIIRPCGRDAWALAKLLAAGSTGITPIEHVGPRWSHYIWKLRTVLGLNIKTVTEAHGGVFAGHHARYILRDNVYFADPADAAAYAEDH